MKIVCGSSLDRISELPNYIKDVILKFLSLQDAARTSVLSRAWRYQWAELSQLVIDETTFMPKSQEDPIARANMILGILLRHKGPILKFTLDYPGLTIYFNIDGLILPLLSEKGIQDLNLSMRGDNCFRELTSIYSLLHLKHLSLHYCQFVPSPPTFKGFRELISLELTHVQFSQAISISGCPLLERLTLDGDGSTTIDYVTIDAPNLKYLFFFASAKNISILSPLLATLSLNSFDEEISWDSTFDLVNFFGGLPLMEHLHMFYTYLKLLAVPKVPKKLPTLNCLRILEFSFVSFAEMDDLSSVLCLIRSSPNLQNLKFKAIEGQNSDVEPVLEFIKMQDPCVYSLNKLCDVKIEGFIGLRPELEFIKFLLAISPELERVHMEPASSKVIKNGDKILLELTQFRRASQKAEIIVVHLDDDQA